MRSTRHYHQEHQTITPIIKPKIVSEFYAPDLDEKQVHNILKLKHTKQKDNYFLFTSDTSFLFAHCINEQGEINTICYTITADGNLRYSLSTGDMLVVDLRFDQVKDLVIALQAVKYKGIKSEYQVLELRNEDQIGLNVLDPNLLKNKDLSPRSGLDTHGTLVNFYTRVKPTVKLEVGEDKNVHHHYSCCSQ